MSMEITVEDVYTALDGDVVDRSEKFIAAKIEEALAMLAGYCPRLANIIAGKEEPDKLTAVRIRAVVVSAVMRVAKDDRSGYVSEKESAYEIQIDRVAQSPNIWFTDKELEGLGCKTQGSFVGSVKMSPDPTFTSSPTTRWYEGWFCG